MSKLKEYNKILKKYFGYESLKPQQYEIIDKVINDKNDVLGVLCTSFGKSMCFQLPYLITNKNVIVISPLISLMKDQQNDMEKLGIPSVVFNTTNKNKSEDKMEILNGSNKIIYITPEYLEHCQDFIIELYEKDELTLFCIDEAHCISTYGNEFRSSYTKLDILQDWAPDIPILALTATASKRVRKDICKILENPHIVIGSFDRPNLYIQIEKKTKNIINDISNILEKHKDDYIIIYCKTREDTIKIAKRVSSYGIKTLPYHAGMNNNERDEVQDDLINGKIKCISATIAFGMGINIKNIRCIIHYGCPKNLESYYQEIGRAGRDGKKSNCYLFYSNKDFAQNRYFISDIKNEKYKSYQNKQIQNIEKYIFTNECRKKLLLYNFDEIMDSDCNNCDNCLNQDVYKYNFTEPAFKILTLIIIYNGKFGSTHIINVLRGSKSKKIQERDKMLELYGSGKDKSLSWWKAVIKILTLNGYIEEVPFGKFGAYTLKSSVHGTMWLKEKEKNKANDIILPITDDFRVMVDHRSIICEKKDTSKHKIKKKWSSKEEEKLINNTDKSIRELSVMFNRTSKSIKTRLYYIAWKLYKKDTPNDEISKITGLSNKKIKKVVGIYKKKYK